MKQFAALFRAIDQTTKTNSKVAALANYFLQASDRDKIWTIALLSHRRPRRTITTTFLRTWAAEKAGLPLWLFEESYHIAGDLAETIALVLPENEEQSEEPLSYWIEEIQRHRDRTEEEKKEFVFHAWNHLDATERFVFNKLITGGFRMGVSQKLMTRALSKAYEMDENRLAHRLMGNWTPNDTTFEELILTEDPTEDLSRPYPFYLAYALEEEPEDLGKADEWSAEWKWDGIRAQWIQRGGEVFLWSRGEELVTDKYPELNQAWSPKEIDVVIDGELLPYQDGHPLSFNALQKRIGRKTVSKKLLKEVPVIIRAYDLLEWKGEDLRSAAFRQRRTQLQQWMESLPPEAPFMLSEGVPFENWQELAEKREKSRTLGSEGLMLKKWDSPYLSGRKKGDWWKWKLDPFTIDAVMIYAQQGHGRRSNLFTDYTFAVWNEKGELIPFTKAYSGLKDTEFREITAFVKKNTLERYGPVRAVKPELVFEVAFEGIARSSRHKSGVALRFPRMKRWRKDKPAQEANTLEDLYQLLRKYEEGGRPEA